jgi:hypothetical protein
MQPADFTMPAPPAASRRPRFSLRASLIVTTLVAAVLGYFVAKARSHKIALRRHTAIVDQLRTNSTTLPARDEFQRSVVLARIESAFPPADVDATLAEFGARIRSASATDLTIDFSKTTLANRPNDVAALLFSHLESGLESLGLRRFHRGPVMAIGRSIWTADDLVVAIDVIIPAGQRKAYVRVLFVDQQGAN